MDSSEIKLSAWHKCPICHKEILKKKLKLATISNSLAETAKPVINQRLEFRLMKREKGTIFASFEGEEFSDNANLNLAESNFALISLEEELDILLADLEKLQIHGALAEQTEIPFFKEAINLVEESMLEIEQRKQNEVKSSKIEKFGTKSETSDSYQYYQASNTRMFLHPINNRCLMEEFLVESSENEATGKLPTRMSGKVVDFETFQVYDDITKRFKFLNHLPEGTTVYLVEVDLKSIHVAATDDSGEPRLTPVKFSKEALKKVKPALDKRRRLRNERKREEQNYEQKFLESQMEELYLFDDTQFPTYSQQSEFYDHDGSFPEIAPVTPKPHDTSNSTNSLASQMKMGVSLASSSTPSFGFAAKMRNASMSLIDTPETYNTDGTIHRPGTPPSCAQITIKTKKTKSKKNKRKH